MVVEIVTHIFNAPRGTHQRTRVHALAQVIDNFLLLFKVPGDATGIGPDAAERGSVSAGQLGEGRNIHRVHHGAGCIVNLIIGRAVLGQEDSAEVVEAECVTGFMRSD